MRGSGAFRKPMKSVCENIWRYRKWMGIRLIFLNLLEVTNIVNCSVLLD